MKLLVIILCLFSERYLIHNVSDKRFFWFSKYFEAMTSKLKNHEISFVNQALSLSFVIVPLVILCACLLFILGPILWGVVGFVLHLIILYYCLGPENPFYPIKNDPIKPHQEEVNPNYEVAVGEYFSKVNGSLFAVIFWYVILGPIGALFYRLASLCQEYVMTGLAAKKLTDILDWLPARLTALCYLLVGNFQRGINLLIGQFFSAPQENKLLLERVGLLAVKSHDKDKVMMPQAENLVTHAVILYLLFLAVFTLISWL